MSCDLYHLYTLFFPTSQGVSTKNLVNLVKIMVIYLYIGPGQGKTTPWGQILFTNSIIQSI